MTDRTRVRDFAQKKTQSVAGGVVGLLDWDGTSALDLFNIPAGALINKATVFAETATQTGVTMKLQAGSTTIIAAAPVGVTTVVAANGSTALGIPTGSGVQIKLTPSAEPTVGKIAVVVEYTEYSLGIGNLTNTAM